MNNEIFDSNEICEYIGDGAAYLDTGSGITGSQVEYHIKFTPVGVNAGVKVRQWPE